MLKMQIETIIKTKLYKHMKNRPKYDQIPTVIWFKG